MKERGQYLTMGASFSLDRVYRWRLWRVWSEAQRTTLVVIGLNPSTADEREDDPTIRRCVGFAKREGCSSLVMLNLFAYRTTSPHELHRVGLLGHDPVGPFNDPAIVEACTLPDVIVVAAWGNHGSMRARDQQVRALLMKHGVPLRCFGLTGEQSPRHPLYLPGAQPLVDLQVPA
jgi:hypothetical protein